MLDSESGYHKKGSQVFCQQVTVFILSVFLMLIGGVSIVSSIYLQQQYSDLERLRFQLWIGLPLLFNGLFGVVIIFLPLKNLSWRNVLLYTFGTFCFIMTIACAFGAFLLGMLYWEDKWDLILRTPCKLVNAKCSCGYVPLPLILENCGELNVVRKLFILEISMASFGCFFSFFAVILSVALLCCEPKAVAKKGSKIYEQVTMTNRKEVGTSNEAFFHYSEPQLGDH